MATKVQHKIIVLITSYESIESLRSTMWGNTCADTCDIILYTRCGEPFFPPRAILIFITSFSLKISLLYLVKIVSPHSVPKVQSQPDWHCCPLATINCFVNRCTKNMHCYYEKHRETSVWSLENLIRKFLKEMEYD